MAPMKHRPYDQFDNDGQYIVTGNNNNNKSNKNLIVQEKEEDFDNFDDDDEMMDMNEIKLSSPRSSPFVPIIPSDDIFPDTIPTTPKRAHHDDDLTWTPPPPTVPESVMVGNTTTKGSPVVGVRLSQPHDHHVFSKDYFYSEDDFEVSAVPSHNPHYASSANTVSDATSTVAVQSHYTHTTTSHPAPPPRSALPFASSHSTATTAPATNATATAAATEPAQARGGGVGEPPRKGHGWDARSLGAGVLCCAMTSVCMGPWAGCLFGSAAAYAAATIPVGSAAGDTARAVGDVAVAARDQALDINEKHQVIHRTKQATSEALVKTREVATAAWDSLQEKKRPHCLTDRSIADIKRQTGLGPNNNSSARPPHPQQQQQQQHHHHHIYVAPNGARTTHKQYYHYQYKKERYQ